MSTAFRPSYGQLSQFLHVGNLEDHSSCPHDKELLTLPVSTSRLRAEHSVGISTDPVPAFTEVKACCHLVESCHEASFCNSKNSKYGSSLALIFFMQLDLLTKLGQTIDIIGKVLRNRKRQHHQIASVTSFYSCRGLIRLEEGSCICPHATDEVARRGAEFTKIYL